MAANRDPQKVALEDEILAVLDKAARGKSGVPWFMSSYQILQSLPKTWQDELLAIAAGKVGQGAGEHRTAVTTISGALQSKRMRDQTVRTYLDPKHLSFTVPDADGADDTPTEHVKAGYPLIGLYRRKHKGE
ncbi:MAG: hypothetical protein BGO98_29450 [Myxococcales bacterium 68-20]|nr:MAG: hypothetical protein BGO98_29450 [Myxococcales bacterium 68-20]